MTRRTLELERRGRRLDPQTRVVAWRVVEGRHVTADEIITALYGNREDGGPDNPYRVVILRAGALRRWLAVRGVALHNQYGRGWYVARSDIALLRDLLAEEIEQRPYARAA